MYTLLVQDIIVSEEVDKNVKHSIRPAASKVAEGLRRDNTGEGPVEKINYR